MLSYINVDVFGNQIIIQLKSYDLKMLDCLIVEHVHDFQVDFPINN